MGWLCAVVVSFSLTMQVASCPDTLELNIVGYCFDLIASVKTVPSVKIQFPLVVMQCHQMDTSQPCDGTVILLSMQNCLSDDSIKSDKTGIFRILP